MANLIIKSSADNLVLQGSDASPAITVGATGTTTFAENATFSGTANNIGTVTAGTLGSAVAFPTGMVIQKKVSQVNGDSSTTSTSFASFNTSLRVSMTALQNNGKYVIHFSASRSDHNSNSGLGFTTLYISENGGAYASHALHDSTNGLGVINSGTFYGHMGWTVQHTASISTGQTIIFEPYAKCNSNRYDVSNNTVISMVVEELQL